MSSYNLLKGRKKSIAGIARVAHAPANTLAACANTHCHCRARRPARASVHGRVDLRRGLSRLFSANGWAAAPDVVKGLLGPGMELPGCTTWFIGLVKVPSRFC